MGKINNISIENVKGISQLNINCDVYANKPTIFVAQNGFGKTSISTAFHSLNRNRINLQDEHLHKSNKANKPKITIDYVDNNGASSSLVATETSNAIDGEFGVYVIKNSLEAKHTKRNLGAFTSVSSHICVEPIVLLDKIPDKPKHGYSLTSYKKTFGKNGKVLPNISYDIQRAILICEVAEIVDLKKLVQVKPQKTIAALQSDLNSKSGSKKEIFKCINNDTLEHLSNVQVLANLVSVFKNHGTKRDHEIEYYLAAFQFTKWYLADTKNFKQYLEWCRYNKHQDYVMSFFDSLKPTWKGIAPKKKSGRLILDITNAQEISNGERDILCFIANLLRAEYKLGKEKCILIIDEVFDYLDDANLISAQYHISSMINSYKKHGREIYPIIMTHLNPNYFRHYRFKKQKVLFLERSNSRFDRKILNMIEQRENPSVKDIFAKHFAHYHDTHADLTNEFKILGVDSRCAKSENFYTHVNLSLAKYIAGKNYDPVSVCCAVRILLEEKVYNALDANDQAGFLDLHGTDNKFDYATDHGVNVPGPFYLLGIIYNEALHIRRNSDVFTPLISKLSNKTITHMIQEACACKV